VNECETKLLHMLDTEGPRLQAILFKLTFCEDAVEELTQELFLNLYRSEGYARAKDPLAYACRSAINLASTWRRTRKRNPPPHSLTGDLAVSGSSPLARMAQREELEEILDAINHLKEPYRLVFVMRYLQEDTYETIADLIHTTPHQARALCHKALIKLRSFLHMDNLPVEEKEDSHAAD